MTLLARWDGDEWTTFGPVETLGNWFEIEPDGDVWVGHLTKFDGSSLQQVELPASADNGTPVLRSLARRSDGSIWAVVVDRSDDTEPTCPPGHPESEGRYCMGETDGLYLITPEAMGGTE